MRRAVLVATFTVILTVAGYWFLSGKRQDAALAQVATAMADVKSAHLVGWRLDSDTGQRRRIEAWVKAPDRFRLTLEGLADAADDGQKMVTVTTVFGVASVLISPTGQFPGRERGLTYLDLFTGPEGVQAGLRASGSRLIGWRSGTLPGKGAVEIAEIDTGTGKAELAFDAESKLLVGWEVHDGEGRLIQGLGEVEYNAQVPDTVFTVAFPPGATVTDLRVPERDDLAATREALAERLEARANTWNTAKVPSGDCGSEFHDGLRFRCLSQGGMSVYYLPDRNTYFVVGKALVYQRGGGYRRIVEDAEMTAPRPPDHPIEEIRLQRVGPPTPPDVRARRDALVRQVEQSGGVLIGSFGRGGSCGSPYHAGLRFECRDEYDYGIKVFYLPARNAYYVIGKAGVYSMAGAGSAREVEDAEIAAPGPPRTPE
jgi:hypothetical protein